MKEFIVRLFSLLAIVGVLFGYNEVLNVRAKDEEITKLNAQLEAQTSAVFSASESGSDSGSETGYKDGTYIGEADGFGGTVAVEVTVKDGKIVVLYRAADNSAQGIGTRTSRKDRSGRSDICREGRRRISCNGRRYHSEDHRGAECRS